MITITFDEAGNTGADLSNKEQPIFALASSNYTKDEADDLLDIFNRKQGQEIKFKNIRRRKNNHNNLVEFIKKITLDKERNVATVYHKEYVIITQIVDIIIEWEMYNQGIDIYKYGTNIALSNIHYHSINSFCSRQVSSNFKKSFIEMIRGKNNKNINNFYYHLWQIHGTCIDENYRNYLEPIIKSEKNIYQILEKVDNNFIDPAISSFAVHCSTWTDRLKEKFRIIHDNSKPIFQKKDYLESLMSTKIASQKIGYDRRKFAFPYNATGVEFSDSKDDSRLQVVDIIASCTVAWGKGYVDEKYQDGLWNKINKCNLDAIMAVKIWPTDSVTPEELGCESSSGVNPLDIMAAYLQTQSNSK